MGRKTPSKSLTSRNYSAKSKVTSRPDRNPQLAGNNSNARFSVSDIAIFRQICHSCYFSYANEDLDMQWIDYFDKGDTIIVESKASISGLISVTLTF